MSSYQRVGWTNTPQNVHSSKGLFTTPLKELTMTTIDIVVPRHIWKAGGRTYDKWVWETYGRYLKAGEPVNLKVRMGWR